MNKLDPFESIIKEAVDSYDLPYDASAWNALQQKMSGTTPSANSGSHNLNMMAACFSGILIAASLSFFGGSIGNDTSTQAVKYNQQINTFNPSELTESNMNSKVLSKDELSDTFTTETSIGAEETPSKKEFIVKIQDKDVIVRVEETVKDGKTTKAITIQTEDGKVVSMADHQYLNQNIVESDKPNFVFAIPDIESAEACVGESIEFAILNENEHQHIEWDFRDGSTASGKTVNHKFDKPGTYEIVLKTTFTEDPSVFKEVPTIIKINDAPKASFDFYTEDNASRPFTHFEYTGSKVSRVSWRFDNGNASSNIAPTTLYTKKGSKMITLEADNGKCKSTCQKMIYIDKDYNLLAPAAFTNNDDGRNDAWFPAALSHLDLKFTLSIIDKNSGKLVYQTRGIQPWDGTDQSTGEKCTSEFYVWQVKLTNEKGQIENYSDIIYNASHH